jgi:multisubunit Na+/H+ antiporter MnhB subunit
MDPILWPLLALLAFMIIGSLIAAEAEDLLSSVVCVGAVGAGLAIINLLLGAPDLAITQVVVEVLCVVVLIRVVLTRRHETQQTQKDTLAVGSVLLVLGVLLAVSTWAMTTLHPFGQPLLAGDRPGVAYQYLTRGLAETGAANHVTAVLLDYRAYDTLGEATVIFVSIMGAYAILRRKGRIHHAPGNEPDR